MSSSSAAARGTVPRDDAYFDMVAGKLGEFWMGGILGGRVLDSLVLISRHDEIRIKSLEMFRDRLPVIIGSRSRHHLTRGTIGVI